MKKQLTNAHKISLLGLALFGLSLIGLIASSIPSSVLKPGAVKLFWVAVLTQVIGGSVTWYQTRQLKKVRGNLTEG